MTRWLSRWLWLTVLVVTPGAGYPDAGHPQAGAAQVVIIENMQFTPRELQVSRGTRIVWINKDLFPHTVTAAARAFDSGSIAANSSWTYIASKSGTYDYNCTFHSSMKGVIRVK